MQDNKEADAAADAGNVDESEEDERWQEINSWIVIPTDRNIFTVMIVILSWIIIIRLSHLKAGLIG